MNNNALIVKSVHIQKQARDLIKKVKIEKLFSSLGKVNFVGSYKLGLMMRHDIDIVVLAKNPSGKRAVELTNMLKTTKKFTRIKMLDSYTKKLPYLPKGYYWELIVKRPEGEWKFDVWYLTSKADESIKPTKKWQQLLTDDKKKLILAIKKKYLKTSMLYSHNLYGAKIYKAVLEQGVKDLKAFQKRIKTS